MRYHVDNRSDLLGHEEDGMQWYGNFSQKILYQMAEKRINALGVTQLYFRTEMKCVLKSTDIDRLAGLC